MDYNQFMKIMGQDEESIKESIGTLQEFVNEFPYFQSAHALLAKSMHVHQHVRFEKQLKIASAYAGDRKSLYDLIHSKKSKSVHEKTAPIDSPFISPLIPEIDASENKFEEELNKTVLDASEEEIEIEIEFPFVNHSSENKQDDSNQNEIEERIENDFEISAEDPHDIIRKRLIEILGLKDDKKEESIPEKFIVETKIESLPALEETQIIPVNLNEGNNSEKSEVIQETLKPKDEFEQLFDESNKAVDFIQKAEIEYALESTLIQSLEKLPIIENVKHKEKQEFFKDEKKSHSFYDWLKIKTTEGYGRIEEVHATQTEEISTETENNKVEEMIESGTLTEEVDEKKSGEISLLIDRFIETSPKIIPSKAEFYSPANQAKKSITEDEDLVSETLAKIYHQQGNLLKARSSYLKLSLLFPEKLAYFAALISELDKAINNQDKQDL